MYVWKCWRDSRTRFIFFLILLLAGCVTFTIYAARPGGPTDFQRGGPVSGAVHLWSFVSEVVLKFIVCFIVLFAALVLAPSSIGEEYRERTLGFLFAQPRRRRYFAWACWSLGACELLGIILAAVVSTFAALAYISRYVYTWRLLAATAPLFVGAVAVYSMTYLLTVLARNGEKGLSYGTGILFVSLFLPVVEAALWPVWHIHVVHLSSVLSLMLAGCGWAIAPVQGFPVGKLVFYAVLALAFPAMAQLILERREV